MFIKEMRRAKINVRHVAIKSVSKFGVYKGFGRAMVHFNSLSINGFPPYIIWKGSIHTSE